jgi:5-methylcytosine-specific restriction endonuclease McrA
MSATSADPQRLRLDPESYEALRQQVLRRDGWRCQSCGAMSNLEVHHKQFPQPRARFRRKPDHVVCLLPHR